MGDITETKRLIKSIPIERYFFNTFGYLQMFHSKKTDIKQIFEDEISEGLNLPHVDNAEIIHTNKKGRCPNLRFSNITNPKVLEIFYNPFILKKLKNITKDFYILSPIESFYLNHTSVHKDQSAEINQLKMLFYLDDVSDKSKGPLWVIPGTHNIYDKYASSVSLNVQWPTPEFGGGGGLIEEGTQEGGIHDSFWSHNMPKHYMCGDANQIIFFNHNLVHGSDGTIHDPTRLRRAIGSTIIMIDRKDKNLMDKIYNLYQSYNITHEWTEVYKYCEKNEPEWLNHFYDFRKDPRYNDHTKSTFKQSDDGTDKECIKMCTEEGRWKHYIDHIREVREEILDNTLNTGYKKDMKWINKPENNFRGL